ncbi:hypothetical protein N5E96_20425 [Pseudomonas mosselii]|uniref:hypothetical protein n=1 Tax=Pseudomonas TaxID=286 RepID=UPI0016453014|nr:MULTISPECIES: hypothetical protein [Pseudomonas]MBC3436801.1 hypothetical protein [Pseudomonas sp. BW16M2]MDH1657055.1 hypothetical protein [Pseudomonas mosselii]MDH1718553.1 hypothetical protein [Pseudomonas mosselii]MDH1723658.1 hypothetical protein [Pseudomonas mosselii]
MKFLDDILQSISGNTKTKIEDPFIGAFLGSWIICNWDNLALLIWGEGTPAQRITTISKYYHDLKIFEFNSLIAAPLTMTALFIFAFPWVSLGLKFLQQFANERLHGQAVSIEISKIQQQEALNKQRLLADPEKEFLGQNVKLDIERRKELIEQLKLRTLRFKEKTETAKATSETAAAAAAEARSRANQAELEEEKKKANADLEKQRFGVVSAQLKSAQASNRFPSAYSLMLKIEESLKDDDIQLSLAGLGEIVAMVFGYENFHSLIHDENFNNKTLSLVSYIYYDREEFASALETIVQNETSENENLDSDTLFYHVTSTIESLEYKLLPHDQVEEVCREICESMKYELLNSDELSGPIAESDTIYDEVEISDLDDITFANGLSVTFSGSASGSHRKEYDVPGRDIEFSVEIKSAVIVGTKGLEKFERGDLSANLIDYYEPESEADET